MSKKAMSQEEVQSEVRKIQKGSADPIVVKAKEGVSIPDGQHTGNISNVAVRDAKKGTDTFQYVDISIKTELPNNGGVVDLRYGYPFHVTKGSGLGKLLKRFGADFEAGDEVNITDTLMGEDVTFLTITSEDGFAEVVKGSEKPV